MYRTSCMVLWPGVQLCIGACVDWLRPQFLQENWYGKTLVEFGSCRFWPPQWPSLSLHDQTTTPHCTSPQHLWKLARLCFRLPGHIVTCKFDVFQYCKLSVQKVWRPCWTRVQIMQTHLMWFMCTLHQYHLVYHDCPICLIDKQVDVMASTIRWA